MKSKPAIDRMVVETARFAEERILVTGGGGFLGAALVRAMLDRGAFVTVLDD